jgi:DNA-directed RNA polymerase, subunit A''''
MKLSKYFVKKLRNEGVSEYVIRKLQEKLSTYQEIPTKVLKKIVEKVIEKYNSALIEPSENIGVVTAQSVGEPGTQMTLRTFHFVGVKELNVTLGLPRLIEIFDARNKPSTPTMIVPLKKPYSQSKDKAMKVAIKLEELLVEDILTDHETDENAMEVILYLDKDAMKSRDVKVKDLKALLQKIKNVKVLYSESDPSVIRISPLQQLNIKQLNKLKDRVLNLKIKGISGIRRTVVRRVDKEDGTFEWVIATEGSNLKDMLKVPEVDRNRVYTNDIFEVYNVLGIEAARIVIIREAMKVLEDQGLDVNIKHIMLIADAMTRTGKIKQIGRHGIVGEKPSPLAKAAFEITTKHLYDAAIRGAIDELKGVAENIIVGQPIKTGTGKVKMYFDIMKYIENLAS